MAKKKNNILNETTIDSLAFDTPIVLDETVAAELASEHEEPVANEQAAAPVETGDTVAGETATDENVTADDTVAGETAADVADENVAADEAVTADTPVPEKKPNVFARFFAAIKGIFVKKKPEPVTEPVADENVVTDENAVADENVVTDENVVADENVVTDENVVADENVVTDENVVADENVVTDENVVADENVVTDENVVADENVAADEAAVDAAPEAPEAADQAVDADTLTPEAAEPVAEPADDYFDAEEFDKPAPKKRGGSGFTRGLKKVGKFFFGSRRRIKVFSLIVSIVICTVTTLSIMLPSYFDYMKYYNDIMSYKEYQKYINGLKFECKGITAELGDDVEYFANGKARPKAADFNVTAHFSEKGKDTEELLSPTDYTISVSEGFAKNGGTVTITYIYTPEAEETDDEEAEAPEPIEFTYDIDIELTPVVIKKLMPNTDPYRIYYAEGMGFAKRGLSATVLFNDGDSYVVEADELETPDGALTAGDESVPVSYTLDGNTLTMDLPITVVPAVDYDDGNIIAMSTEDEIYVYNGEDVTQCDAVIFGRYESGNRVVLNRSDYTITANDNIASFMKNCVVKFTHKSNPAVYLQAAAAVRCPFEAEDAIVSGGNVFGGGEYEFDGVDYTNIGYVNVVRGFVNGDNITFNVNSEYFLKASLVLRVANNTATASGYNYDILPIRPSDYMRLEVNGTVMDMPSTELAGRENVDPDDRNRMIFTDLYLPQAILYKGMNTIKISFKNISARKLRPVIAIDKMYIETVYSGKFYASTDAYVAAASSGESVVTPSVTTVADWRNFSTGSYVHGMATDGEYIYAAFTGYAANLRGVAIAKFNTSGTLVAVSAKSPALATENSAGLCYYDGKLIVSYNDGTFGYVNAATFTDGSTFSTYDGFHFEGAPVDSIKHDVYYNVGMQRFAVRIGNAIYIYDKDQSIITSCSIPSAGATAVRMSGSPSYIYVNHSGDGKFAPIFSVFDWDGKYIGKYNTTVADEVIDYTTTTEGKGKSQGLAILDGDIYFAMIRWGTKGTTDSSKICKIAMPEVPERNDFNLPGEEYILACLRTGTNPVATIEPIPTGAKGSISNTTYYSMGGVSDGKYMYVSNKNTVWQIDPVSYTVVCRSLAIPVTYDNADYGRMFIRDGVLYWVYGPKAAGRVCACYGIELEEFEANCKFTLRENVVPTEAMTNLKGAQWNETLGNLAVLNSADANGVGTMSFYHYETNGTYTALKKNINIAKAGYKTASVCADNNFVFVTYSCNAQNSLPFEVYDWDGNRVATMTIDSTGAHAAFNNNYNIQGVFAHNGEMYLLVCNWDSGATVFLWKVNFDISILNT